MMKAIALLSLCALLLSPLARADLSHGEDAAFLAARDAYARGDRHKLAQALSRLHQHPLTPWAQYFQLSLRLKEGDETGVAEFIEHHDGSWLAEKLRAEWLKWLVERQDWARAQSVFARLERPDADASCRSLEARVHLGDGSVRHDAQALLASSQPLAASCRSPLAKLAAAGELANEGLWERLRRQWALNRLQEARLLATWLPASETLGTKTLDLLAEHPARHLAQLPEDFARERRAREAAALAVLRLARSDVRIAAGRWQEIEAAYPATERGAVWALLAQLAALAHRAEAPAWFDQAERLGARFDEEQHAWRLRATLRAGDWSAFARISAHLPAPLAAQPEWLYWRGRALMMTGKGEEGRSLLRQLAQQPHFYGILASEALGQRFVPPPSAEPPTPEERLAAARHPQLVRGLMLIRAELRNDGVREWSWGLKGMNDRQLLAAADFARRHDMLDRAISAAERTRSEHDYLLRYPSPFYDLVAPQARARGLDPAWVYGLMRQESRFVLDAKSSAGARGLMQLMPATAKWVAQKIGLNQYHPGRVDEMEINVTLGTHYLRMVLDGLDNHPVLASAAYNAGPGRARKWRAETPLEGAIYAETIPFSETRDYVKKVLANTVVYSAVMRLPGPSLSERLGTIRPRGYGDASAESLP